MKIIKELRIEKLVYKGLGLGFENSNAVFVSNAVPGDVVDVQVLSTRRQVSFGKIEKIVSKSSKRIDADCEVFGKCGGCDWLNISYDDQLKYKQMIVEEIFQNIEVGKINEIIDSGKEPYRNKSFFPVAKRDGKPITGMFESRSHNVIPHDICKLQPQLFDDICGKIISYTEASKMQVYNERNHSGNIRHIGIRYAEKTNEIIVILVTRNRKIPFSKQLERILLEAYPNIVGIIQNINTEKTNVILGDDEKILFGRDYIIEQIRNTKFKLNYKSFFQVNTKQAEKMYEFVKQYISEDSNVIDAYCGVGSIGIYLADKAAKVIGIENNVKAVQNAKENAKLNKIENCEFVAGYVETELQKVLKANKIDTIIFDPPRKGLEQRIIDSIPTDIKKIIYISCDPMTQVRDVKLFMEKDFVPKEMQPVDMFPHTYHIENIIILER
ncbi:MAG: 23S rRNA (uracil(1939)-C(5))-methyltransferase RlmD [Candidatus Cloacimonetes bacterium]|jgi:23S rRNA (uracil1939-C5)-methyltransferase|nr:23S rRNA (uracil(1939)-C(5))-methyltransferase RlmD [Candidatus Cloacimonadota bacterium]MBT4332335.1 23S rRNA (uracil(1939)-C(5))-methyltransferase RlmD [Candidatus Cloacimonadota bacterium]MBT4576540.1 23S rRNA (uracil(1939)-C(5))-methyltransferase RlmD [Candidatus Cloacimonadota bacterium]MBT5419311.1 23S rRNA (uracil(1939)-C(5))-methyltransferase RlmD [Candidatus Cloacimonadota bacterium]